MQLLIVDENKIMRRIIQRTLRQSGYEDISTTEAEDGEQAYTMICADRPDLIVSNWNMPRLSGINLLRRLRAEENHTKFGFISSHSASIDARRMATEAGALFMLAKPLTVEALRFELAKLIA